MNGPFLVVGLGNPGPEYAFTRHNLGFLVVDRLAEKWRAPEFRKKFRGLLTENADRTVYLLKPQTFMNLSGESVIEVVNFYKIDPAKHLIVIADDLDLPPGQLRLRTAGSSGGNNGLKSVIQHLGTEMFPRLRVGIGRSTHAGSKDHVLAKIKKSEETVYREAIELAAEAVEMILRDGVHRAMEKYNRRLPSETKPEEKKD